jgi:hypothetical protein
VWGWGAKVLREKTISEVETPSCALGCEGRRGESTGEWMARLFGDVRWVGVRGAVRVSAFENL